MICNFFVSIYDNEYQSQRNYKSNLGENHFDLKSNLIKPVIYISLSNVEVKVL